MYLGFKGINALSAVHMQTRRGHWSPGVGVIGCWGFF